MRSAKLPDAVVEILRKLKGESLMNEADKNAVWNSAITRIERIASRSAATTSPN